MNNNNTINDSNNSINSISTSRSGLLQFVVGEGVDFDNLLQINRFHELQDIINQTNAPSSNLTDQHDQQSALNSNQPMYRTNLNRSNNTNSQLANEVTTSNNQVVLDLASNNNQITNESTNDANQQALQQQQHQIPSQDQNVETNAANGFFMLLLKTMQSSLPFFIILVAKIFHQHLLGFFIVLGFMTTLHWSNRTLVYQIQLKEKKQNHKLILLILFLVSNVIIFFFIFKDSKLENCLIFMSTNIHKMDTWNLIWIVVCSDTIIKFLLISIKSFITLLPFNIIPLRKRGNYYSAIENCALFYRSLTPIHPWMLFLMYSEPLSLERLLETPVDPGSKLILNDTSSNKSLSSSSQSKAFPIFLCILYIIFKINQMYNTFNELNYSIRELLIDNSYGLPVSLNENDDNICPICQDKYKNPVILKCKHTFCQDCVCVWLDKENSCPMCRSRVSIKKPKFKDGSTTISVQWF